MAIIQVTKENFKKEVLEADQPVIVDFFATGVDHVNHWDLFWKM